MKAACVRSFGGLDVIHYEDIPRPEPAKGEVLVRVRAAGVGPWDAWVREGKSALHQPLPLVLGADLSGIVEAVGEGVVSPLPGDEVFGVTNSMFIGAYAEYAIAQPERLAPKPPGLGPIEAASVPVVAVTAWQMLFDYGGVTAGKRVLIHGAAGNVGAFAVQLARKTGAYVIATAFTGDVEAVRSLGANEVIDIGSAPRFEDHARNIDIVIDTVGNETLSRSFDVLRTGGILVSSVSIPDQDEAERRQVRGVFFLVDVTTDCLNQVSKLLDTGEIQARVGEVLPLSEARLAHAMLAGRPHRPGKIVLIPALSQRYSERAMREITSERPERILTAEARTRWEITELEATARDLVDEGVWVAAFREQRWEIEGTESPIQEPSKLLDAPSARGYTPEHGPGSF